MEHDPGRYEGTYSEDSAYGSAVRLIRRSSVRGVVMDLGCGYGPVAEPLTAAGLTYIGLDVEPAGLVSLDERGFETAIIDLELPEAELAARLVEILNGRALGFIVMLDVLEHLRSPERCLSAATMTARANPGTELVLSLPNVTHVDVVAKALLGRWDRTDIGLLDRTHLQLFGEQSAVQLATALGWTPADRDDVVAPVTEQCTPADAPHLRPGAPLHDLLETVRARADGHGHTYQFVRRYRMGETAPGVARAETAPLVAAVLTGAASADPVLLDDLRGQVDADFAVVVERGAEPLDLPDVPVVVADDDDLVAAVARSGARYVMVAEAGTRLSPRWVGALRADLERAPGRVVVAGCADGTTTGARLALAPLELLGTPHSGVIVPAAYLLPAAALVEGGLGPLGPTADDLVVTIARCIMWCGRFDSAAVTMAASRATDVSAVVDHVTRELDTAPLVHAPGALVPVLEQARRLAAAEALAVQLQERHERYAEAREAELAELHARMAQQSTPGGALRFAVRCWAAAVRRWARSTTRRPNGDR